MLDSGFPTFDSLLTSHRSLLTIHNSPMLFLIHVSTSLIVIESLKRQSPIRVRHKLLRYPPTPNASPKSFARLRIYVPVEQTTLNPTSDKFVCVISNSFMNTFRDSNAIDSPFLANL